MASYTTHTILKNALDSNLLPYATHTILKNALDSNLATYTTHTILKNAIDSNLLPYTTHTILKNSIDSNLASYPNYLTLSSIIDSNLGLVYGWLDGNVVSLVSHTVLKNALDSNLATYTTHTILKSAIDSNIAGLPSDDTNWQTSFNVFDLNLVAHGYLTKTMLDGNLSTYTTHTILKNALDSNIAPLVNYTALLDAIDGNIGYFDLNLVKFVVDDNNVLSVSGNSRFLVNSLGVETLDWENSVLKTGGSSVLDWSSQSLIDTTTVTSVDWQTRLLNDGAGGNSVDYNNRLLFKADGSVAWDWENTLYDSNCAVSGSCSLVAYLDRNDNFDSGTLFIDASNNKVGIGTTNPTTKLELYTASGTSTIRLNTGQTSYYSDIINNYNSGTAFQITHGGLNIISSSSQAYNAITLGNGGATLVISPQFDRSSFTGEAGKIIITQPK